jgi:hypothetical protein
LLLALVAIFSAVSAAAPARAEWWEARTERETRAFATELERFDHALRSLQAVKFAPITSDSQRVMIVRSGDIQDLSILAGGGADRADRRQQDQRSLNQARGRNGAAGGKR